MPAILGSSWDALRLGSPQPIPAFARSADRASKDEEARTLAIRAPTLDATRPSPGALATRWKVTIPGEHANLNVTVDAKDQELVTGGPRYKGSAAVTGTYGHRHVTGSTYIEVTASK